MTEDSFTRWLQALDERHLANLRVQEVTRALRALSSVYVERREALTRGAALDSAGKRAAFALFYGPLHYLLTRHIVEALGACTPGVDLVIDVGCGTGAGGAAWAVSADSRRQTDPQIYADLRRETDPQIYADLRRETDPQIPADSRRALNSRDRLTTNYELPTTDPQIPADSRRFPRVLGIDRHPWAVTEARWTYRVMGLDGSARREDVGRVRFHGKGAAIALVFTVNEISEETRAALLPRLMRAGRDGARVLVVEPVARSIGAWWPEWADAFRQAGGREDTWRFEAELPDRVRQLDRAAGLDHRVLTARSLYL